MTMAKKNKSDYMCKIKRFIEVFGNSDYMEQL